MVTLSSSNPAIASVPAAVIVPAGATRSADFSITTSKVSADTVVTITATRNGGSTGANLTVATGGLTSFILDPASPGGLREDESNRYARCGRTDRRRSNRSDQFEAGARCGSCQHHNSGRGADLFLRNQYGRGFRGRGIRDYRSLRRRPDDG